MPARSQGRWRAALSVGGVALLVWFVVAVKPAELADAFMRARPLPLAGAAAAVLANLAVKGRRWQLISRWALDVELPMGRATGLVPVGVAAGTLVPGHAVDLLGKPSFMSLQHGAPFGRAVGLAVWERLFDFAVLLTFAGAAALGRAGSGTRLILAAGSLAAGAAGLSLLVLPNPLQRVAAGWLGGSPAPEVGQRTAIAALSAIALALEMARAALVAVAFAWPRRAWEASVAFLLGSLAGVLSLVPGGMGVTEWSATAVLAARSAADQGHRAVQAAAIVAADRFLAYYLVAAAGALLMALWSRSRRPAGVAKGEHAPPREGAEVANTDRTVWIVLPAYNAPGLLSKESPRCPPNR